MTSPGWKNYRGPLGIFLAALILTAALTGILWRSVHDRERLRFVNEAQRTQGAIESRMQVYMALLQATAGLFEAQGRVTPPELSRFIQATELEQKYPGIQGVGFSARIPASQLPGVVAAMQQYVPGFHVRPETPREEYHAILMLEPLDRRNRKALGFDMYSEKVRRAAMERARDTGQMAASGRVTLVQEIDTRKQPGFLIYQPIYSRPPASLEERRSLLEGFVYSPFRVGDLLQGVLEHPSLPTIAFQLFDGATPAPENLMYTTPEWSKEEHEFTWTTTFLLAGTPWTLEFGSLEAADADLEVPFLPGVVLFGVGMSGVLFLLSASQARARWRAEQARRDAQAAERRVSLMAEASDALGSSVDLEPALQVMCERLVPEVADACMVHLLEAEGSLRLLALHDRRATRGGSAWEFWERFGLAPDATRGPQRVVRTGNSELCPALEPSVLEALSPDPEARQALARLGFTSYLCVPLMARGQCLGTLTLIDNQGRNLDDRDLLFAQEIAERAARAVDNGRLYRAALEATSQARGALRAKDQFIATVSHELRTPLNGITGMVDLLLDTGLTPSQREYATTIQSSSEVLRALIEDILDFSRLEVGKLRLQLGDFDLRSVLRDVVDLLRPRAEARGLTLDLAVDEGVPVRLRGDSIRLYQVLINLVGNAVKFTLEGGVKVRVSSPGDGEAGVTLRFEVQDTGVGIEAGARERLFEPFYQVDPSSSRRFEGTGLGLAITHQLVVLMQGEMGVESEPGKGSTFWFTAFFERASSSCDEVAPVCRPGVAVAGLRVLVAEDNPVNRRVVVLQLERMGIHAGAVGDGKQALEELERRDYDLVLMDCQMPVMDGFKATRELRQREARLGRRTPVVALTASVQAGAVQACRAAGMDDVLAKPLDRSRLQEILEGLVSKVASPSDAVAQAEFPAGEPAK